MTATQVAKFFQAVSKERAEERWVWEQRKERIGFTSEADLVAAVAYLRKQTRAPLRLEYISQLYLPIYLVSISSDNSLIIGGVGTSSIMLKNVTILPPEAFENLLSHVDDIEQVPRLITNLDKLVKNLHPTSITLPNVMKPSMADPIRRLIDHSLSHPSNKVCIESTLDTKGAIELGSAVREEISRLDHCHEHLMHMLDAINRYIEVQLQYINEERMKIHQNTAAELGMAQLLNHLEGILKFATNQCRQFIVQMDSSPTKTDLIFKESTEDLIQPQILAHDFRQTLQQTSIELDAAFSQLEAAERQWSSIYEQENIGIQHNMNVQSASEYTTFPSSKTRVNLEKDTQLSILVSLRERILGNYPVLIQTLHDLSSKLEKQYNRFIEISAKMGDLQGEHQIVKVLVPIFMVKTSNPTRYAIIPPLKLLRPTSPIHWKGSKQVPPVKAFNVTLFDESFCIKLQDMLRSEMVTRPKFRDTLDKMAHRSNKLKHKKRIDQFLHGVQELSLRGLLSTHLAHDLSQFWIQIK